MNPIKITKYGIIILIIGVILIILRLLSISPEPDIQNPQLLFLFIVSSIGSIFVIVGIALLLLGFIKKKKGKT